MKKILFLLMFPFVNLWVFSQNTFNFATTNDDIYTNLNVQNTGNDAVKKSTSNEDMRVTVDDGDSSAFVWSIWDGSSVTNSGSVNLTQYNMNDPDVALVECGYHALVVYENNGDIYAIHLSYSGGVWGVLASPSMIGRGYHPNIDSRTSCGTEFVATWDYLNCINARYLELTLSLNQPIVTIFSAAQDAYYDYPDVTVCNYSTNVAYVTFCARQSKSNGNSQIVGDRELLSDIYSNTLQHPLMNLRLTSTDASTYMYFGHPRIASPANASSVSMAQNFTVVVDRLDYDTNNNLQNSWIEYSNCYLGTINGYDYLGIPAPTPYVPINIIVDNTTSPPSIIINLDDSPNKNPVVAYCGDNVLISWQYYDQQGYTNNNGYEILQRKIGVDGSQSFLYFSVVNYDIYNDQTIPSISGRFTFSSDAFYSFFTTLQGNVGIGYKSSNVGNYNLRKLKMDGIKVYPTITNDICKINSIESIREIEIIDVTGKTVRKINTPTEAEIDVKNLEPGTYFISISTDNLIEIKKIIKI